MNEPLETTLTEAIDFLEQRRVEYALIGGLAVSLRGQPRVTADVDMVIAADVQQARSLLEAVRESNFEPLFEGVDEVVETAFILPLRHRATNVKVDLSLGLSGFEKQVVARALPLEIGGRSVVVASAEDLLLMKVLAGRPQDELDARGLVIAQGSRLDWDYCLNVAADLGAAVDQDLVGRVNDLRRENDGDS